MSSWRDVLEAKDRLTDELLGVLDRFRSDSPSEADMRVIRQLPSAPLLTGDEDARVVEPLPSGRAAASTGRLHGAAGPLRSFLTLSLGYTMAAVLCAVFAILVPRTGFLWGSLTWSAFMVALPFELVWIGRVLLGWTYRNADRLGRAKARLAKALGGGGS